MARESDERFVSLLDREKTTLTSFLLALTGDRNVVDDLYQTVCLELWRLRRRFQEGTDFGAWSRTVARYHVLRHWRKISREKLRFSTETVDRIAEAYTSPEPDSELEDARAALEDCVHELTDEQRALLKGRYNDGLAVKVLARETNRSEVGVKVLLLRLRRRLARCVESKLKGRAPTHG